MPKGATATPVEGETLDFPVGTIITKSFGFPDDARKSSPHVTWIETRVMAKTATGWQMNAYTWDAAQKRAALDVRHAARDLLEAQQRRMRHIAMVLVEHFLGHAVAAAEVAPVRDADAQVGQGATQSIDQDAIGGQRPIGPG